MLAGFMCDLPLFLMVSNFWVVMSKFATDIENDMNQMYTGFSQKLTWPEIYRRFKAIREMCRLLNRSFGAMVILYLTDTILLQSMALKVVITATDLTYKLRLTFFMIASCALFVIAADANHKLSWVTRWLAIDENRRGAPTDELTHVKEEIWNNQVGIRGANLFTITYTVIWNVS